MRTIFEMYQQLNESFQSKYIRMLAQDALLYSNSFRDFVNQVQIYYVAWDNITDNDIMQMVVDDDTKVDVLKMFRALKAGKDSYWSVVNNRRIDFKSKWCILLGYRNHRLTFTYNSRNGYFYSVDGKRFTSVDRPREMESDIENRCDLLYIILVDKHDTRKLISDRDLARSGMVPDLDDADRIITRHAGILGKDKGGVDGYGGAFTNYCRRLAQEAIGRWKQIIAENKFKQTADTKEIDQLVEDTVQLYFRFMQDVVKASSTNKEISQYRLGDITDLVTGKAKSSKYSDYGWLEGGLLNIYRQYCQANVTLQKGGSYAESELKSRDNAAKYLKNLVPTIKERIERLKTEWKM